MKAIFLINRDIKNSVTVQLNHEDYLAVNVEISISGNHVYYEWYTMPNIGYYSKFRSFDRSTRTIMFYNRKLEGMHKEDLTVTDYLVKLKKIFKIKHCQLNVNSNFDSSNLIPFDLSSMVMIAKEIESNCNS